MTRGQERIGISTSSISPSGDSPRRSFSSGEELDELISVRGFAALRGYDGALRHIDRLLSTLAAAPPGVPSVATPDAPSCASTSDGERLRAAEAAVLRLTTEVERLRAAQPTWSHAEALRQRAALIAANVDAQADLRRLRDRIAELEDEAVLLRRTAPPAPTVDEVRAAVRAAALEEVGHRLVPVGEVIGQWADAIADRVSVVFGRGATAPSDLPAPRTG